MMHGSLAALLSLVVASLASPGAPYMLDRDLRPRMARMSSPGPRSGSYTSGSRVVSTRARASPFTTYSSAAAVRPVSSIPALSTGRQNIATINMPSRSAPLLQYATTLRSEVPIQLQDTRPASMLSTAPAASAMDYSPKVSSKFTCISQNSSTAIDCVALFRPKINQSHNRCGILPLGQTREPARAATCSKHSKWHLLPERQICCLCSLQGWNIHVPVLPNSWSVTNLALVLHRILPCRYVNICTTPQKHVYTHGYVCTCYENKTQNIKVDKGRE